MLFASVAELIGTISIFPFMKLASDPDAHSNNTFIRSVSGLLNDPSQNTLLLTVGLIFIILISSSNILVLTSQFLINRFSFRLGGEISSKLFDVYVDKSVLFFKKTNSSYITQKVMRDSQRFSSFLVLPYLRLNSRILSITLLTVLLFTINPTVAFISIVSLSSAYVVIFKLVRAKIHTNGKRKSIADRNRNRIINETLDGIREIKLYSREKYFTNQFNRQTKISNRASADNNILGESPYYLIESLVFSGVIFVTLYLIQTGGSLSNSIPTLTIFCLAGLKLIPKIQQSYVALTKIKASQAIFNDIYNALHNTHSTPEEHAPANESNLTLSNIYINSISYSYDNSKVVLHDYSATIPKHSFTLITGESGSGKSTLLDIILGLTPPNSGNISVGNIKINASNIKSWHKLIGYTSNCVHVIDDTIKNNITYGNPYNKHEFDNAITQAELEDVISNLEKGSQTRIGERGTLLSSGQIQRIGIARALYKNPKLLILDEATNALDNETQFRIFNNLKNSEKTVILVSHRTEASSFANNMITIKTQNEHIPKT